MKIIEQYFEWMNKPETLDSLKMIEKAGRTCYKSEEKINDESYKAFVRKMVESDHHAMIEISIDPIVKIVTNRGVTHELVRHRLCSFAQESTRYVDYNGDDIEFIQPEWWDMSTATQKNLWLEGMRNCELIYKDLRRCGWSPQKARDILPNALKTEIVVKANMREWRHIFELRCSSKAHPQIQNIMKTILSEFYVNIPIIFDDLARVYFDPEAIEIMDSDRLEKWSK